MRADEKAKNAPLEAKLAFTMEEAAIVSGLSRASLYNAIREDKLTPRKWRGRTLIPRSELVRFLDALPVATLVR